jgi:hypothetical protein
MCDTCFTCIYHNVHLIHAKCQSVHILHLDAVLFRDCADTLVMLLAALKPVPTRNRQQARDKCIKCSKGV